MRFTLWFSTVRFTIITTLINTNLVEGYIEAMMCNKKEEGPNKIHTTWFSYLHVGIFEGITNEKFDGLQLNETHKVAGNMVYINGRLLAKFVGLMHWCSPRSSRNTNIQHGPLLDGKMTYSGMYAILINISVKYIFL